MSATATAAPAPAPSRATRKPARPEGRLGKILGVALRILLSLVFGLPLIFMIVSSFKPDLQIFADLGTWKAFLPVGEISLDNYLGVFDRVPFATFLMNSVFISVATVVLGLVVNSMAAFALARLHFGGRKIILGVILATLIVPFETMALPLLWWVNQLPWLGVNAIHGLADVLNRLAAHDAPEVVVDGLTYREGMNAVRVSGGVAGNVVPPTARIEINYRFAPDKSPDDALAELRRVLPGYDLEVTDMAGGARPGLDHPLVRDFLSGADVQVRAKYGWTDVARFSGLGIPALNYGPGDPEEAHTDGESCPVGQLEECAATLRRWLTGSEDR